MGGEEEVLEGGFLNNFYKTQERSRKTNFNIEFSFIKLNEQYLKLKSVLTYMYLSTHIYTMYIYIYIYIYIHLVTEMVKRVVSSIVSLGDWYNFKRGRIVGKGDHNSLYTVLNVT